MWSGRTLVGRISVIGASDSSNQSNLTIVGQEVDAGQRRVQFRGPTLARCHDPRHLPTLPRWSNPLSLRAEASESDLDPAGVFVVRPRTDDSKATEIQVQLPCRGSDARLQIPDLPTAA